MPPRTSAHPSRPGASIVGANYVVPGASNAAGASIASSASSAAPNARGKHAASIAPALDPESSASIEEPDESIVAANPEAASIVPAPVSYASAVKGASGSKDAPGKPRPQLSAAALLERQTEPWLANPSLMLRITGACPAMYDEIEAHVIKTLGYTPFASPEDPKHPIAGMSCGKNNIMVLLKFKKDLKNLAYAPFSADGETFPWFTPAGAMVPITITGATPNASERTLKAALWSLSNLTLTHLERIPATKWQRTGDWTGLLFVPRNKEIPKTIKLNNQKDISVVTRGKLATRCAVCKHLDPALCCKQNADTLAWATRRPPAQILPVPVVLQHPTKPTTPSTAKAAAPCAMKMPASSQPEPDASSDAMDISEDFSVLSVAPQPAPKLAPCPTNDAVMVPANPDTANQEIAAPTGAPLAAIQDAPAPPSPKLAALAEPTESAMPDLAILAATATAEFEMHSQQAAPMPADPEPATTVATTGPELAALAEASEQATDSSDVPAEASAPTPTAESTVHANLVFAADAMSAVRALAEPRAPTFTTPEGIAAPEPATASFADLQTAALARPAPSLSLNKRSQPKAPNAMAAIKATTPAPSTSEFAFPARRAQPAEEQEDESWEIHPDEAALHRPADDEASTSASANASTSSSASAKQKKPLATKVRRGRGTIRPSADSTEKRIWNQTHAPTARGEAPDTFVPFHLKRRGITR
ncbi:hypothetical protein IWW50_004467, partial [Coemansia erecta]